MRKHPRFAQATFSVVIAISTLTSFFASAASAAGRRIPAAAIHAVTHRHHLRHARRNPAALLAAERRVAHQRAVAHRAALHRAAERRAAEHRAAARWAAAHRAALRLSAARLADARHAAGAVRLAHAEIPAGGVWRQLRSCESGGNYREDSGNGYYGAYQFSLSTWRAMGGAGLPNQAPYTVQDTLAERLQANGGWHSWPSCSVQLGLG